MQEVEIVAPAENVSGLVVISVPCCPGHNPVTVVIFVVPLILNIGFVGMAKLDELPTVEILSSRPILLYTTK